MSHFYNPVERALLKLFDKTEEDVLIRYGKFLAEQIKEDKDEKAIP